MSLDLFLHNLHFDIEKLSPPGWKVDWQDAPLTYKLYEDAPSFQLSLEVPLTLEKQEAPSTPDLYRIGHFLWYTFGLTNVSQSLDPFESSLESVQSFRRFVPSGGGLYPNELYVYLKIADLPVGVYHYDVAHHRLILLREGNFDSYLARALGNRCTIPTCFAAIIVTTMFWKNFFKYNNLSYRLQGLDAGVLIGQILEVSKRFGFEAGVYFQFLDQAINHLLGIAEKEESTYAIIPLSVKPTSWLTPVNEAGSHVSSSELFQEIPAIQRKHYSRSKRVKDYPMLLKMNKASMINSTESIRYFQASEQQFDEENGFKLPFVNPLSYDLAAICRNRFSPEMDYILGKVDLSQLSLLLKETMSSFLYRNDLHYGYLQVALYCCLYNVENLPNGAYFYDNKRHALKLLLPGDHRTQLQYAMTFDNVNLQHIPLCVHAVGDSAFYKNSFHYRGYRIQQMEAGMLVQRLLLTATALGMGGHPLLGYDASSCDAIYKLSGKGKTSLIQVPLGFYRDRPWLRGSLHS